MGTLLRLLLLIVALWVILRFLKKLLNKADTPRPSRYPSTTDVLRCGHCGTYVPRNEGIDRDGKFYCSHRHLEAAERKK